MSEAQSRLPFGACPNGWFQVAYSLDAAVGQMGYVFRIFCNIRRCPKGRVVAFDPEAVHAKYLAERDKRLVPGRAAIRDLTHDECAAGYQADPFTPLPSVSPSPTTPTW